MNYDMPDFASLTLDDFKTQIAKGIDELRADIDRIGASDESASFDNTCLPLEMAGLTLERAYLAFETVAGADSTPEIRAYENELAPILDGVWTDILLDERLWARIDAVHSDIDQIGDAECRTLVERQWLTRKLAGADLPADQRDRVRDLGQQIARLEAEFSTRLLEDTIDAPLIVETPEQLAGLSPAEIQAAKDRAAQRGIEGYAIKLTNVTNHPLLAQLADRETRRRLLEAQQRRGGRGNEWDTSDIVCELARLRAELANLLGYPNHVARKVADEMAGTPQAIEERLYPLASAARANAEREAAALQQEADRDADERGTPRFQLEPWDWQYYATRLRAREHSLDEAALMPYFEYERVLIDGVFYAATKLYGITFTKRPDVVAHHPDVQVFEVFDDNGESLALFCHDVYNRDGKRGGAWMHNIVEQSRERGTRPIVCNTLNVSKPPAGEPTLLTLDEVVTMFHEFGHALHGILSNARFASLSGTNVPRDFVEFPSQVNEMWLAWPEVLDNYARHVDTGEVLDAESRAKLAANDTYNQGFLTSELLAAALLDQEWHKLAAPADVTNVDEFEQAALRRIGLDNPLVPPRYRSRYFEHTFGGGYDGGYYSYLWSEVMDADTVEWFRESGGLTRENGDRFRQELLSRGRTRDLAESYRAFRGRDPHIEPLLRRRGLAPSEH